MKNYLIINYQLVFLSLKINFKRILSLLKSKLNQLMINIQFNLCLLIAINQINHHRVKIFEIIKNFILLKLSAHQY
jgi:hypothetical protein